MSPRCNETLTFVEKCRISYLKPWLFLASSQNPPFRSSLVGEAKCKGFLKKMDILRLIPADLANSMDLCDARCEMSDV